MPRIRVRVPAKGGRKAYSYMRTVKRRKSRRKSRRR